MHILKRLELVALAVAWVVTWTMVLGALGLMATVFTQPPQVPGTPTVKLASGGGNAYYDTLVALPQRVGAWSLRSQAQINSLKKAAAGTPSLFFFYDPAMDAAKYVRNPVEGQGTSIPGGEQLRMPLGNITSGDVLVIWDFWYGDEWVTNKGYLRAMKTFQIRLNGDKRFFTYTNGAILNNALPFLSRPHASGALGGTPNPEGLTAGDPYKPPGGGGALGYDGPRTRVKEWTRYWVRYEMARPASDPIWADWKAQNSIDALGRSSANLSGTWMAFSLWMAQESLPPTRLWWRVPVDAVDSTGAPVRISSFEYEFNTSTSGMALTGPLIGYGRNVVVLRNYPLPPRPEDDTTVFVAPR